MRMRQRFPLHDSRKSVGKLVRGVRGIGWWCSAVLGGQQYRRYCQYLAEKHPEQPIPTERAFWREHWKRLERSEMNRCC